MTQLTNGHSNYEPVDLEAEAAIEGLKEVASQAAKLSVIERAPDEGTTPFEQKTHDLMLQSVDRIAHQWVEELKRFRDNTVGIEKLVIEHAGKAKDELTRLHLLGVKAMGEARRGHEVLSRLGDEIESMITGAIPTNS